jgi:hypothetical protein
MCSANWSEAKLPGRHSGPDCLRVAGCRRRQRSSLYRPRLGASGYNFRSFLLHNCTVLIINGTILEYYMIVVLITKFSIW